MTNRQALNVIKGSPNPKSHLNSIIKEEAITMNQPRKVPNQNDQTQKYSVSPKARSWPLSTRNYNLESSISWRKNWLLSRNKRFRHTRFIILAQEESTPKVISLMGKVILRWWFMMQLHIDTRLSACSERVPLEKYLKHSIIRKNNLSHLNS